MQPSQIVYVNIQIHNAITISEYKTNIFLDISDLGVPGMFKIPEMKKMHPKRNLGAFCGARCERSGTLVEDSGGWWRTQPLNFRFKESVAVPPKCVIYFFLGKTKYR